MYVQVCRVAYELMQTKHGDASQYFHSLDDVFYFGGQNAHNLRAVEPHKGGSKDDLSFEVGDLLGIAGNHWDGFSKGTHRKSGKSGLFPSYKVVNDIVTVKMPTYPEVKEEESEDEESEEEAEQVGVAVDYGHRWWWKLPVAYWKVLFPNLLWKTRAVPSVWVHTLKKRCVN